MLDVIDMWERDVNEHGKPLTKFEVRALVDRWCELFGCFPPSVASEPKSVASVEGSNDLESRANDDLMTRKEVADKLRVHLTTIQRLEQIGRLPEPVRLGARGRRHRVADIRAFIESLGANRR